MHPALNPFFLEKPHNLVPFLNTDCVDVINVLGVGRRKRRYNFVHPIEHLIILQRMGAPQRVSTFKVLKFDAEDSSLDTIHPAVPSDHGVVIFADLTVISKNADFFLQFKVVCHDRAGFAKRAQILTGIEAEASGVTKRADLSSLVIGSVSLGGILNHQEIVPACEL